MTDCVIYTRVSSREQEDGFSLDAQLELLRKYAIDQGFQIKHEFREIESAKAPGRPVFDRMLDYLKVNPDVVLLVEKTDRLVRNLKDYITLDDLKINVHFAKEGTKFGPGARSSDRFMQGIKVLVATQYSENLSEEIMKGMTKRAQAGKWSCTAPYGYRMNHETKSLELVPGEAEAVRWLYSTYATGDYSLKELCKEFRAKGFPWRNVKPIYPTLAHKMLNNPVYMGIIKWGEIVAPGEHEPIVDPALWEKVHKCENSRSRPKSSKHEFAYRGLVRCGDCGCLMTGSINKGYRYYKCSNSRGNCTNRGYIREEQLTDSFTRSLQRIVLSDVDSQLMISALRDFKRDEIQVRDRSIEKLTRDVKKLQGKIDQAYDDYQEGDIDRDMWKRNHHRLAAALSEAQKCIQLLEKGNPNLLDHAERLINAASRISDAFEGGDHARRLKILKACVSNCTLMAGILHHDYKKPFDIIAEGSETTNWWS